MPIGTARPAWLGCVAPVLVSSFLWLEKESAEVDSELDKLSKPNWGLTCQLAACCHHCHKLGRGWECLDQPVPKVTTKIVSMKCVVRSKKIKEGEGERSRWTEAEMSAVVVVHQNIEHIVISTTSGAGADLGSSSDVSCCGGHTSEFCMQHRVQQSLKKWNTPFKRQNMTPQGEKRSLSFVLFGVEREGHHNSGYAGPESVAAKEEEREGEWCPDSLQESVAKGQLLWWPLFHRLL